MLGTAAAAACPPGTEVRPGHVCPAQHTDIVRQRPAFSVWGTHQAADSKEKRRGPWGTLQLPLQKPGSASGGVLSSVTQAIVTQQ